MEGSLTNELQPDVIQIENRWYVLATSSRADDRTRVLKDGETFGVYDRYGDVHPYGVGEQGLYHEDTRYLSRFELCVNGKRPLLLNSTVKTDNSLLLVDLTTPDLADADGSLRIRKDTLHIFRARLLYQGVQYEHLRISNYSETDISASIDLTFEADFADIFEVRGIKRTHRGRMAPPVFDDGELVLRYQGLDGLARSTHVRFQPAPSRVTDNSVHFAIAVAAHEARDMYVTVACEPSASPHQIAYDDAFAHATAAIDRTRASMGELNCSNQQFNDWIHRSAADLGMLVTETAQGPYPYAGVPWYSTAFGRDGLLAALQCLWLHPLLGRGVLSYLAAHQAGAHSAAQDAEPGKIMHETRKGEMAALGEVPFKCYYGSVDATPLFVMLAGAYYQRTGDREFVQQLWPHVERALEWIDRYGDADGDGFIEYHRHSHDGLLHQGWKDSSDAVFHADGSAATGPIALCEVQGYVYAARKEAAGLAQLLGQSARALELERQAAEIKRRFNETFWCPDIGSYALALDGAKRPCRVRTSNAGHALYTGIAAEEYAQVLAETLLAEDSFNGWGVRTVSASEQRYNPMAYHNGSVWPHDTALVAAGLARYGYPEQMQRILTGLFEASVIMDLHRLPELFCGFRRRPGHAPTLYPVACSPQAWSAAAVFLLVQSCLGLSFAPTKPQLRFQHPLLPDYLDWLEIRNLRVAGGNLDLRLTRYALDVGINVTRKSGDIEIAVLV